MQELISKDVFTSSNGWAWEIEEIGVAVFDEEGWPMFWLPKFDPTEAVCAAIVAAYDNGRTVGEKIGRRHLQAQIRNTLGLVG